MKIFLYTFLIALIALATAIVDGQQQPIGLPTWITQQRTPTTLTRTTRQLGCQAQHTDVFRSKLMCIESYLDEQLTSHGSQDFKLPQTYRVGWDFQPPLRGYPATFGYELSMRADVYDSSLAAIFLTNQGKYELARKILDSFLFITQNDPAGDGRTRAAYYASSLVMNQYFPEVPVNYYSKILDFDAITGNMAFQVLALSRFYHHNREYKYLKGALRVADFIDRQLKASDSPICGYYGGFSGVDQVPLGYRSTSHNLGIFAAAKFLYTITQDNKWKKMLECAETFVAAMFDSKLGTYRIGTVNQKDSDDINLEHVSTDAATWKVLSGCDDNVERNAAALQWVVDNTVITEKQTNEFGRTNIFKGVIFATGGFGWQSENTASAALAFQLFAKLNPTHAKATQFKSIANDLLNSLVLAQEDALNTDGHCIVASLRQDGAKVWPGNEFAGESWRYFPFCHTSATGWTGLLYQAMKMNDLYANPYSSYAEKPSKFENMNDPYNLEDPSFMPGATWSPLENVSFAGILIGGSAFVLASLVAINVLILNLVICACCKNYFAKKGEKVDSAAAKEKKITEEFKTVELNDVTAEKEEKNEEESTRPGIVHSTTGTASPRHYVIPLRKTILRGSRKFEVLPSGGTPITPSSPVDSPVATPSNDMENIPETSYSNNLVNIPN